VKLARNLLLPAIVVALVLAATAMAGTSARSAATCTPPKYPGVGYFTTLSVSHTSCATGRKVVLAYYHCRLKHGRAGHCTSKVLGYKCTEKRNSIPTEIDARVVCKLGSRSVTHTYQQDL
jgi:hypothetical protein